MSIDTLLQPFQRFGIHLGLERIHNLLADLGNPHHQVPIVHVAGTNGKGSVCAYLSSVLTEAGYKVGRYTSPHLVDWTERICLNQQPIPTADLEKLLRQIQGAINPERESPTQFEVITAAAWLYFAKEKVDIAVIEVGLGGRLDATNVCDLPLVTAITSLSLEHWQRLGPTLADIAREKAGILKPNCPAVIGKLPPEAHAVVAAKIEELGCPVVWVEPAKEIDKVDPTGGTRLASYHGHSTTDNFQCLEYPLPLHGDVQLANSALAIACLQVLHQQGWEIPLSAIQQGMAKTRWRGRVEWTSWQGQKILVDGAHNPAAAKALRRYVDTLAQPVTWVIGMLSTKDHQKVFQALLHPGDRLNLVPVPGHSTAQPEDLANLARNICPDLAEINIYTDLFAALKQAKTINKQKTLVLCGSLYLQGYFWQHQ